MPKTRLTAIAVERFRPPKSGRTEIADSIVQGLQFRVTDRGVKSWSLLYRIAGEGGQTNSGLPRRGKLRRLTLGSYPTVDLTGARKRARAALELADAGKDPATDRATMLAEQQELRVNTFGAASEDFMQLHRKRHNTTGTSQAGQSVLDRFILPRWRDRPLSQIRRRDVHALLDEILEMANAPTKKSAPNVRPHAAERALQEIRGIFNWAVRRDLIETSPAMGVRSPIKSVSRDRVLADDELRLVWAAAEGMGFPFGPLYQMLTLTAQRRNEVAQLRWSDVEGLDSDAPVWHLEADRTKSGRKHDVPLSPQAVAILEGLPRFSEKSSKPGTKFGVYCFSTTGGVLPVSGFSKAKARLDGLVMETLRRAEVPPLPPWRVHDLRRTAASGMARLGVQPVVLARVLNHSPGSVQGVTAIYNRHSYTDEIRHALETWSAHVETVIAGHDPKSNVITLERA